MGVDQEKSVLFSITFTHVTALLQVEPSLDPKTRHYFYCRSESRAEFRAECRSVGRSESRSTS